jgi:hypothetical protein
LAITQAMCTSFKQALLDGEMDFSSDSSQTFKIALYDSSATLDATTTAYTASGEVSGTGYSAGGETLSVSTNPTTSGTTAFLSLSDVTWSAATITARGALIYLADGVTDPAVAVLNFGSDITSTNGDFTVQFPAAAAATAILRLA